ncbi:hypothetical protein COT64_00410 [Candidatus Shapirobacteria bacterium CG09_land_8_20_14_0_10_39_12]|uniref:Uncharacterized protein n=1 Tax=Candidatus Shapirobacteria bacterium CG09_land_8_20_14_0_10_39_12 TaxID=1974885 RepID=A0A2H0WQB3_9BACT|nr:MAG: hypothetical protein COT64_00410 [Candidatus Shapirobacteria bacterium CG09_land_8_20_14_0_10_39_12]
MTLIATNIFSKLTKEDKQELRDFNEKFGKIDVYEYITEALDIKDVVTFILEGFDVKNFLRDSILWDLLKELIQKLVELSASRTGKSNKINFWVKDTRTQPPLNISFSIMETGAIPELLISLKQTLDKQVGEDFQKGKIIWITYDIEKKEWNIKVF